MKREEMIEKIQDEVSKNYITTLEELKARCKETGLDWSEDILGGMGWNCCDRCGALGDSELDLCWIDCIDWNEDDPGDKKLLENIAKENADYCAICWHCMSELKGERILCDECGEDWSDKELDSCAWHCLKCGHKIGD